MVLPHRFWVLVGTTIGLTALASAFGVVQQTYADLWEAAGCGSAGSSMDTCENYRLAQGAADVAIRLTRVPALGLAVIAGTLAIMHVRAERQGRPPAARQAAEVALAPEAPVRVKETAEVASKAASASASKPKANPQPTAKADPSGS